jgi:hypothetical protein
MNLALQFLETMTSGSPPLHVACIPRRAFPHSKIKLIPSPCLTRPEFQSVSLFVDNSVFALYRGVELIADLVEFKILHMPKG